MMNNYGTGCSINWQQPVANLAQSPWGHNLAIGILLCKSKNNIVVEYALREAELEQGSGEVGYGE